MVDRNDIARRLGPAAVRRRRHRQFAVLGIGLLVVAGVLIAVGRDDDDTVASPSSTATTAAAGDDKAPASIEAACRANNAEIGTAQRALLSGNESPNAVTEFLADAFVDLNRDRIDALRAAPEAGDDEVAALIDDHEAIVDAIEIDPGSFATEQNPFADLNERWRALGLDDCAIDTSTVPQ